MKPNTRPIHRPAKAIFEQVAIGTLLIISSGCGAKTGDNAPPAMSSDVGGGADGGALAAGGQTANASEGNNAAGAGNFAEGGAANGGALAAGGIATNPVGGHAGAGAAVGGTPANVGGSSANAATGGKSSAGGNAATGGATAPGTPAVNPDSGYVTVNAGTVTLSGFASSYEAGSGSSITLTYNSTSFCASGTVAASTVYQSWAGAGFSVNQAQTGASGSTQPLVLSGSTISITYENAGGSTLEFQLYDGTDYWCYELPASSSSTTVTIPLSSLNTQCWNGDGSAFTSGTPITTVELVVPGTATGSTPFNFCFEGLTVQ